MVPVATGLLLERLAWDRAEPGASEYDSSRDTTTIICAGLTCYCGPTGATPPPRMTPTTTTIAMTTTTSTLHHVRERDAVVA